MLALLTTVLVALGVSFLCSVLEAALFSVRDTELKERADRGERGARMLKNLKENRLDDAIAAILVLNTVAHTIGAAVAGAQAADLFGSEWLGLFSAILTLLVLVATEIIPKTLGAVHASGLVTFVAYTLGILTKLLLPALFLTRAITGLIHKPEGVAISRGEVKAMVESAAEGGSIPVHESRLVVNALRLRQVHLKDVMTPRPVVTRFPADTKIGEFERLMEKLPYTRVPLTDTGDEDVIGYVRALEAIRAAYAGKGEQALRTLLRPISTFDQNTTVGEALRILVGDKQHIAVVHDEFGGMAGIVTLEDLLETLIGAEILDETDQVPDLRKVALEIRDKRMKARGLDRTE